MQDARAYVEPVEHGIGHNHQRHENEPDAFHICLSGCRSLHFSFNRMPAGLLRTAENLSLHDEDEQDAQYEIQSHVPEQGKEAVCRVHVARIALCRAQESVYKPGLPSHLCSHPSSSIC